MKLARSRSIAAATGASCIVVLGWVMSATAPEAFHETAAEKRHANCTRGSVGIAGDEGKRDVRIRTLFPNAVSADCPIANVRLNRPAPVE